MKRDVYIAIMRAADEGKGLRLTAEECADLSLDDAISTYAANGLKAGEWEIVNRNGWHSIDPKRPRKAANMAIAESGNETE